MTTPQPHEPITIVVTTDPALDRRPVEQGGMDIERYWQTRDASLIREIPGRHARRFKLRPLLSVDMDAIEGSRGSSLRFAFQFALEQIDNHRGKAGNSWRPTSRIERGANTIVVVGDDEVDTACEGSRSWLHEVAGVALTRAHVGPSMPDGVRYALQPSSGDVLGLIELRAADTLDRSGSGTQTTPPPASETPAQP